MNYEQMIKWRKVWGKVRHDKHSFVSIRSHQWRIFQNFQFFSIFQEYFRFNIQTFDHWHRNWRFRGINLFAEKDFQSKRKNWSRGAFVCCKIVLTSLAWRSPRSHADSAWISSTFGGWAWAGYPVSGLTIGGLSMCGLNSWGPPLACGVKAIGRIISNIV